jgi:DNA-binding PadR family transcriptional regulator
MNQVFEEELKRRFVNDFLDLLILQLVKAQPAWGYNIIKKTEAKYGVKLRHGALYPMLSMLETEGLINSRKEIKKGRVRKTYEITKEGTKLLHIYYSFLKEQTTQGNLKSKKETRR